MNINNNFTPLAWHEGNRELQSNRATYAYGHIVPLFASATSLIPFQIITEVGAVNLTTCTIRLHRVDGTTAAQNIRSWFGSNLSKTTETLRPADVTMGVSEVKVDVIMFNGGNLASSVPTGQYYLSLISGGRTWYSDVLTVVADVSKMTRIVWWDEADIKFGAGMIKYRYGTNNASQYKNVMYFMEELGMPEYTVEEEGETRDGLFYASKVMSGKKYKMTVVQATEPMCDAMRFIHLSDWVEVHDGYGRSYSCDSVLVTPNWINGGVVASVDVEITTDTFVKQLGAGYITGQRMSGVLGEAILGDTFVLNG